MASSSRCTTNSVSYILVLCPRLSPPSDDKITTADFQACAPAPLGAAALLATGMDEGALTELLHPVSFKATKASRNRRGLTAE